MFVVAVLGWLFLALLLGVVVGRFIKAGADDE